MAKVTLFINQRIIKYSIYAIFTSRVRTTISHNSKSKGFNVSCKLTEDTYAFIVFHESLVNQKNCWGSLVKWYQLNVFLYSSTESKGCVKKRIVSVSVGKWVNISHFALIHFLWQQLVSFLRNDLSFVLPSGSLTLYEMHHHLIVQNHRDRTSVDPFLPMILL